MAVVAGIVLRVYEYDVRGRSGGTRTKSVMQVWVAYRMCMRICRIDGMMLSSGLAWRASVQLDSCIALPLTKVRNLCGADYCTAER
jgi:hypothetical protein